MHRILNELEQETAKAADTFVTKTNFIDALHDWVEFKKFELRTNSYELYTLNLNTHIIPFFKKKNKLITEITPKDIEDYYKTKLKEGLSVETIKKHNVIIRGTLEKAMNEGIIPFNPCDRVRMPRKNRQDQFKGQAYTPEQANKLLEVTMVKCWSRLSCWDCCLVCAAAKHWACAGATSILKIKPLLSPIR